MSRRVLLLASLVVIVFILQGCTHPEDERTVVQIPDMFSYDPDPVEIPAGTEIMWNNVDDQAHTATADDESWDSGSLGPGDTYSQTFDEPGEYPYHCVFHASVDDEGVCTGQCGTIIVTEAENEAE